MKNFCLKQNFKPLIFGLTLFSLLTTLNCAAGFNALNDFGKNQNSAATASSSDDAGADPAATPNAQTSAQCRNILRGDARNKPNDRGELPADFPVPRATVLCGYVNSMRATYYINQTLNSEAVAQYYRETLPAQGFELQMDNPKTGGGRFMNFGRGTSETIQVETNLSASTDYNNVFSIGYVPPIGADGVERPTTIMRRNNSNQTASTPNPSRQTANNQTANNQNAAVCGNNPLGSVKCAIALQEHLKYWEFSILYTDPNGKRQTYQGERSFAADKKLIIRVKINGTGRDGDGEWWFRLGNNPLDNGQRVYVKENGAWRRMQSPPENFGEVIPNSTAIAGINDVLLNTLDGTETINGQLCNRFRSADNDAATTIWISQSTGYAVRKMFKERGYTIQTDNSRQDAETVIETPTGAN